MFLEVDKFILYLLKSLFSESFFLNAKWLIFRYSIFCFLTLETQKKEFPMFSEHLFKGLFLTVENVIYYEV